MLRGGVVFLALATFAWVRSRGSAPGEKAGAGEPAASRSSYTNRALIKASPRSSATKGEAVTPAITGIIYDEDGAPLAGATVAAKTFQVAGNLPTTAGAVVSDERGGFEIRVPEGMYYVSADKEGYGPSFVQAHSGDAVSLALPSSGVIEGHVYNERKEPVQHFTIDVVTMVPDEMAAPPPLWSKTFDSPDGSFRVARLPPWLATIRATAPGYAPTFSPLVGVAPKKTQSLDLTLASGCDLEGRVVDKSGAPVPHVFIDAEARTAAAGSGNETSMDAAAQAESDNDGRFRLQHVPAGPVLVRGYDGANAVSTVSVDIKGCDKIDPVKLEMSAGGALAGVVRGADGKPIAGARLTVSQRSVGFVSVKSDGEGRYRLDQLPATNMRVDVEHRGRHTQVFAQIKDGETLERDIALGGQGSGEIRGRVTAGDKPLAGAQVLVASNHGEEMGADMIYTLTGADGTYRVSSLPEGGYIVQVVSTMLGSATQLQADKPATIDLDIGKRPIIVGMSSDQEAAPPPPAPAE